MQFIAVCLIIIIYLSLLVVTAILPRRSTMSVFELERRSDKGDETAKIEQRREILMNDVMSIRRVVEIILLILVVILIVAVFGPFIGSLLAIITGLTYGRLANLDPIRTVAGRLYDQVESSVLRFIENYPLIPRLVRSVEQPRQSVSFGSREELEFLIEKSGKILSSDEKKMIASSLKFQSIRVEDVMTPRNVVESVQKGETIGPLVLDELHKTGHSRFPVIDGDIDHVVGILHIKELLVLSNKKTQLAEDVMDDHVYYINLNQTLNQALAAFIKTRHHLFIVVNGYRETAGIISIEDVMEKLLGRQIADEYDLHDDLRVVALREARNNNNPSKSTEV